MDKQTRRREQTRQRVRRHREVQREIQQALARYNASANQQVSARNSNEEALVRLKKFKRDMRPIMDDSSDETEEPMPMAEEPRGSRVGMVEERNPGPGQGVSRETLLILTEVKKMRAEVRTLSKLVKDLHDAVCGSKIMKLLKTVDEVCGSETKLPFGTIDAFFDFEEKLEENETLKKDLTSSLKSLMDRNNSVSKSSTAILKKFFLRDVVTKFTAKKKVEGKTLFKATNLGKCTIDALTRYHTIQDGTPVNDEAVLKVLGSVISNAKDWEGRKRSL